MKCIVYPQEQNKIAVVYPCISVEDALQANCISADVPYKIIDSNDINNIFFGAYEFNKDQGVVLIIEKAKDIKRNQFRQARKPLLEQLDVEYMRAVETSNAAKKKSIVAKKQELRDVTSIELPDDIDELAKFWPDVLKSA
jgi:hypothetical protein